MHDGNSRLDFLRGIVRPYIQIITATSLVGLGIYFAIKYDDPELAKYVVTGLVGAGLLLIGEYAGERSQRKRKENE